MVACGTVTVALGMLRQRSRLDRPVGLLLAREEMAVENTVLKLVALFRLVWAREKATASSTTLRGVSAPKSVRLSHQADQQLLKGHCPSLAVVQAGGHCRQQYTLEGSLSGMTLLFRLVQTEEKGWCRQRHTTQGIAEHSIRPVVKSGVACGSLTKTTRSRTQRRLAGTSGVVSEAGAVHRQSKDYPFACRRCKAGILGEQLADFQTRSSGCCSQSQARPAG